MTSYGKLIKEIIEQIPYWEEHNKERGPELPPVKVFRYIQRDKLWDIASGTSDPKLFKGFVLFSHIEETTALFSYFPAGSEEVKRVIIPWEYAYTVVVAISLELMGNGGNLELGLDLDLVKAL